MLVPWFGAFFVANDVSASSSSLNERRQILCKFIHAELCISMYNAMGNTRLA